MVLPIYRIYLSIYLIYLLHLLYLMKQLCGMIKGFPFLSNSIYLYIYKENRISND